LKPFGKVSCNDDAIHVKERATFVQQIVHRLANTTENNRNGYWNNQFVPNNLEKDGITLAQAAVQNR